MTSLRLLHVASEMAPLAKAGGLADVVAALSAGMSERGHEVRVVLPLYRSMQEHLPDFETDPDLEDVVVRLGPHAYGVSFRHQARQGVTVYAVDCPALYDREGIYTEDPDESHRFALLSRAALSLCQETAWAPDVIHLHDWHTALSSLYLQLISPWERLFDETAVLLTLHNLGYQGVFAGEIAADLGLMDFVEGEEGDEEPFNFLGAGIASADHLTTVSETYAQEIQTEEGGMGLHQALAEQSSHLTGIVNGVDDTLWNPGTDTHIAQTFTSDSLEGKSMNKAQLLEDFGLQGGEEIPLLAMVSRLVWQKGLEIVEGPLERLLEEQRAQVVVLGSGEEKYEAMLTALGEAFPGGMAFQRGYDEALAHRIEAGADFFLMPSRYEPCGLNQMYSMAYGTVPIVRRTGGLADTVTPCDEEGRRATGIVFDAFTAQAFGEALGTALALYGDREALDRVRRRGMETDYTWSRQVEAYEKLYRSMLESAGRV